MLLSDATVVFVLDIVPALIINCGNYSGLLYFPFLEKQHAEQEKPVYTDTNTERGARRGRLQPREDK